ncbi:MAG: hypothetical protein HQK51_17080, partial [Oligoflexia bacterium]|nr:hypothetical protein [Oligoflexia bacterium]
TLSIKNELEKICQNSEFFNKLNISDQTKINFEIFHFKTSGDQNTSVPLWQLKGENFFTKELDHALLEEKVDLVIHSFKDIGGDRPTNIMLAAVPKRSFAHDIFLIKDSVIAKLFSGEKKELIVGTSSPRRSYLLKAELTKIFQSINKDITLIQKDLRGNVNTRLKKLYEGQNASENENAQEYDAIILALAGLERLYSNNKIVRDNNDDNDNSIKRYKDLNFLVLPPSIFPWAPAQGALAVECRQSEKNNNSLLYKLLQCIDHPETHNIALAEKNIFSKYGGGCHQAIGVGIIKIDEHHQIQIIKGEKDTVDISSTDTINIKQNNPTLDYDFYLNNPNIFIGLPKNKHHDSNFLGDELIDKVEIPMPISNNSIDYNKNNNFFVTSDYCICRLKEILKNLHNHKYNHIWCSGIKTMKKLLQDGFWVNGVGDYLGSKEVLSFKESSFINYTLPTDNEWYVLTRENTEGASGNDDSLLGEIISCYKYKLNNVSLEFVNKLKNTSVFYWTSFEQFKIYSTHFPFINNDSITTYHATGTGKTYREFKKYFINEKKNEKKFIIMPFTSIEDFKKWTKKQQI